MSASLLTYPLDFARGRISGKLAKSCGTKQYRGIAHTLSLTIKDEGLLAVYKGVTPTLLGAMPYEGIKFGTVGVLEVLSRHRRETICRCEKCGLEAREESWRDCSRIPMIP